MQNNTFSGLFVGKNVIALQQVDSTNNYLKNHLSKSEPLPEGTVIMAEEQFAGRGQFSNRWLSQPGKNLTFSLLLCPSFLNPDKQFLLNIAVSIAINDVLARIIGCNCKIKWPNDIFFGDNKLGGILIENILRGKEWKYAIIGIGINVNQTEFPESIKNVTSLKLISSVSYDLSAILRELCQSIQERYIQLRENHFEQHYQEYISRLYRFGEQHRFKIKGSEKTGRITGVDEEGRLNLDVNGEICRYGFKEIAYVLS